MMFHPLFTPVANLIRQTAETVTEPAQADLALLDIQKKSDGSIVTRADGTAEAFLTGHLTKILPDSKVLGEETAGNWRISPMTKDPGTIWIIDPIDGTKSYSRGESYGIMVALRKGKILDAAWIYYPRTKDMLFASKDDKTHRVTWADNGIPTFHPMIIPHPDSDNFHLTYYIPAHTDQLNSYAPVATLFATHKQSQCIAQEIRTMLQSGTSALFCINHFTPWDHEPTRLILEQSGGSVYFLRDADENLVGTIYAPTQMLAEKILQAARTVNPQIKAA